MKKIISLLLCLALCVSVAPLNAFATGEIPEGFSDPIIITDDTGTHYYEFNLAPSGFIRETHVTNSGQGQQSSDNHNAGGADANTGWDSSYSGSYSSSKAATYTAETLIKICKGYKNVSKPTSIYNKLYRMRQLNSLASQDFVVGLSFGDALLLSLLEHEKINTGLITDSYSLGDINAVIAGRIFNEAKGYVSIEAIAEATGLTEEKVSDILERISAGTITKSTIEKGKNSSSATNRGPLLRARALEQEKVFNYLTAEIERMTGDEASLEIIYNDLGGGYAKNLIAGRSLDSFRVSLYKQALAELLDEEPIDAVEEFRLADTDAFKVTKKLRSLISDITEYEFDAAASDLPDKLKNFLDTHLKNGVLSEADAREYLILSGEFKKGQHGIGQAAKQLSKGYEVLEGFNKALSVSGKVLKTADYIKKADDLLDYWADDFASQQLLLDHVLQTLNNSGENPELLVAAKQLQKEYENKVSGTFDKLTDALVDKSIGALKGSFPPLVIAEATISLAGLITGADKKNDALTSCLAMQGICLSNLESFEAAVQAVYNGDESEAALNRVLTGFALSKESLCTFYESLIVLAENESERTEYKDTLAELNKLSLSSMLP